MRKFAFAAILGLVITSMGWACFMRSPQPVRVQLDHITIDIEDQVAVKKYVCTFFNPNPSAVVGAECYMEVEPGSQVDNMTLQIGDKKVKAEILDVNKAKKVFQDMVKEGGSPALLEFYGNQLIRSQVPRIPAKGTVKIILQYTTVLKPTDGMFRLKMLNTNPKTLMQALDEASVKVRIKSKQPVTNIYSPTHNIDINEKAKDAIEINWSQKNYLPKNPFVLYYSVSQDEFGANMLAFKEPGEDGFFMAMISPPFGGGMLGVKEEDILPKDIVFCVDTSGSMLENGKMEQAKKALKYCIKNLRDRDRFNIVSFSTEARAMSESGLVKVDNDMRERGDRHATKLNAVGGTAIEEALGMSLKQFQGDERVKMIFFMTDGLPTIGESNADKLIKKFNEKNDQNVRLFCFGEGYDVNTKLLDALSLDSRGASEYIMPEEKIDKRIASFYDKVGSPMLSNLELKFEGIEVLDVYPKRLPDLLKGEQLIVYGRYKKGGMKEVNLLGDHNGIRKTISYRFNFPEKSLKTDIVPRLWAGQKVNFLLAEMRRNGENKELIEVVTKLAKRYGIVTPYTSYLITEDIMSRPQRPGTANRRVGGKFKKAEGLGYGAADKADEKDREEMAKEAKTLSEARKSKGRGDAYAQAEAEMAQHGGGGSVISKMRYIGSKTFYKNGGLWYDSTYDCKKDEKKAIAIKVGSDEYFDLIKKHSAITKYLALVDVIVKFDGKIYKVTK